MRQELATGVSGEFWSARRALVGVVAVLLAAGLAWLLVGGYGWNIAPSVGTAVGLPLAMLGFLAIFARGRSAGPQGLADVTDQLVVAVTPQWEAEAELRRLNYPP